jgi:Spy/CpxP family protein refolding chaperone
MTKLAKWVLAAAFAVAVAGAAQAQRQPGQGGGRGGMGMQQSIFMTALTNADLQKELKITDDQKKALKPMMEKAEALNKERQEMFAGGAGGFDRDKMTAMMEKAQKLGEEVKAAAEKALTADQVKRAKQIEVQVMGMRAFSNEEIAKKLNVTDEQKEKLKGVMEEYQKEGQDLRQEYGIRGFGGGGGGGEPPSAEKMAEYTKKNKALTDETMEKIMKGMTDEQKKMWKEMTGEAFDVSKLMPARPMRRDN